MEGLQMKLKKLRAMAKTCEDLAMKWSPSLSAAAAVASPSDSNDKKQPQAVKDVEQSPSVTPVVDAKSGKRAGTVEQSPADKSSAIRAKSSKRPSIRSKVSSVEEQKTGNVDAEDKEAWMEAVTESEESEKSCEEDHEQMSASDIDSEEENAKAYDDVGCFESSDEGEKLSEQSCTSEDDMTIERNEDDGFPKSWDKLIAREERYEQRQRSKKLKNSSNLGAKSSKDFQEEEVYTGFKDEDFSSDESAELLEDDELEDIWRDAFLVTAGRKDDKPLEENAGECQHMFIFMDDIGKVCELCGRVGQLVTETFDIPGPFKRIAAKSSKKRQYDDATDAAIPLEEEEQSSEEETEDLTPHSLHHKLLREHQKEAFNFLSRNLIGKNYGGAVLAHAPGTGKSFLAVSFLHSYFARFPKSRALIAAPKNMLEPWRREFMKWKVDPGITVYTIPVGNAADKVSVASEWCRGTGVLLITLQLLALLADLDGTESQRNALREILLRTPDILIVDEAHYARTEGTKIFSVLRRMKTRRRIFLSGTLFQNNVEELLNLLRLCRPNFLKLCPEFLQFTANHRLKTSLKLEKLFFKEKIDKRIMESQDVRELSAAINMFRSLTSPFLHWHGGQVLDDLPGLVESVVVLTLSEDHRTKIGSKLSKKLSVKYDNELATACVHPCLGGDGYSENLFWQDPSEGVKTAFVFELLRKVQRKERVIIFSQFKRPLKLLKQMFKEQLSWSENTEILHMSGKVPMDERQRVTDEFNSKKSKARVLLATIKACGEGISLVGGSRVVILDTAWNPSVVRQAVSRAFRIGQTKKVYVYRLLAHGTFEVEKHCNSMRKDILAKALLDPNFSAEKLLSSVSGLSSLPVDQIGDSFLEGLIRNIKFAGRCSISRL